MVLVEFRGAGIDRELYVSRVPDKGEKVRIEGVQYVVSVVTHRTWDDLRPEHGFAFSPLTDVVADLQIYKAL